MYGLFVIIIAIILLCILLSIWLWFYNNKLLLTWWNNYITHQCSQQDLLSFNGIPSYHNALDTDNKCIRELHTLIHLYNNDILAEVNTILDKDNVSNILIRTMGRWSETADLCPILKDIVSLFPEVLQLQILISHPGTVSIDLQGQYKMLQSYHYGLKVSPNDIGLKIDGFDVKWEENTGFVWDATLPHSMWNHTNETRIVILAEVLRDLTLLNNLGSMLIFKALTSNNIQTLSMR